MNTCLFVDLELILILYWKFLWKSLLSLSLSQGCWILCLRVSLSVCETVWTSSNENACFSAWASFVGCCVGVCGWCISALVRVEERGREGEMEIWSGCGGRSSSALWWRGGVVLLLCVGYSMRRWKSVVSRGVSQKKNETKKKICPTNSSVQGIQKNEYVQEYWKKK